MFERFTEPARRVVVVASDEARLLGHAHVGAEHLLLGLLHDELSFAFRVLNSFGLELADARTDVERVLGRAAELSTGQIHYAPEAKAALDGAVREATRMGHPAVGTEHLLLGLIDEGGEAVARVLSARSVEPGSVRGEVERLLGWPGPGRP